MYLFCLLTLGLCMDNSSFFEKLHFLMGLINEKCVDEKERRKETWRSRENIFSIIHKKRARIFLVARDVMRERAEKMNGKIIGSYSFICEMLMDKRTREKIYRFLCLFLVLFRSLSFFFRRFASCCCSAIILEDGEETQGRNVYPTT